MASSVKNRSTVLSAVAEASQRHGIPLNIMIGSGRIESGLRPHVKTGSYKGLYQLSESEFRKYGGGNIYDPRDNANAFARLTLVNMARFRAAMGRNPSGAELYLMHQQGTAGAAAHMSNPDAPAWVNMLSTGEGRRKGSRWAKKAIWGNVPPAQKRKFGSVENIRSADFVNLWKAKYQEKSGWKEGTTTTAVSENSPRIPSIRRAALDTDRQKFFRMAQENLRLNKRESRMYQSHLANLWGSGGVDNGLGSRSTLLTSIVESGGRHYIIPTVWDGKQLSVEESLQRARKAGLARFPSYSSAAKAEARYNKMHEFMDMDGELYASANAKPAAPAMSELSTVSAEAAAKVLPPPPPTFSVMLGGLQEPEPSLPGNTGDNPIRTAATSRKPEPDPEDDFSSIERLSDVFGSRQTGSLYQRPDQGPGLLARLPERPPLLRDLFAVA